MRLVVFDIDGTLLDSQDHIVDAQRRAFAACGLPNPSRAQSLSVVGLSLPAAFAALVGQDGPIDRLCAAYLEAWTAMRAAPDFTERLYPGAAPLVAALRQCPDLRLGIATGKSKRGVDRVLAAQGWQGAFAAIATADDHPSKPHPGMLEACLATCGVDPADAMMVGDTTFDMDMARSAKVPAIGVTWGYHAEAALRSCAPAAIVGTFDALAAVLSHELDTQPLFAARRAV